MTIIRLRKGFSKCNDLSKSVLINWFYCESVEIIIILSLFSLSSASDASLILSSVLQSLLIENVKNVQLKDGGDEGSDDRSMLSSINHLEDFPHPLIVPTAMVLISTRYDALLKCDKQDKYIISALLFVYLIHICHDANVCRADVEENQMVESATPSLLPECSASKISPIMRVIIRCFYLLHIQFYHEHQLEMSYKHCANDSSLSEQLKSEMAAIEKSSNYIHSGTCHLPLSYRSVRVMIAIPTMFLELCSRFVVML